MLSIIYSTLAVIMLTLTVTITSSQGIASETEHATKCSGWGSERILVLPEKIKTQLKFKNITVSTTTSCFDQVSLNIDEEGRSQRIGQFFMPYSHDYKLHDLNLQNRSMILFEVVVSEPDPTNSHFYAIVDLEQKAIIYSGYSDSQIELKNLDNRVGLEIILGKNLSGIDPLDTLIDFVPYPTVLTWGCYEYLQVFDISSFPLYFTEYKGRLVEYKKKLKSKMQMVTNKKTLEKIRNEIIMLDILLNRNENSLVSELYRTGCLN